VVDEQTSSENKLGKELSKVEINNILKYLPTSFPCEKIVESDNKPRALNVTSCMWHFPELITVLRINCIAQIFFVVGNMK